MKQNTIFGMYRLVSIWVGLMTIFAITGAIAMARVSTSQKFANQPFHSETCASKQPKTRTVVSWLVHCSQMSAIPDHSK